MEPNSEIPQPDPSKLEKILIRQRTVVDNMIAKIPLGWRKKILPAALGGTMAFMTACGGGQPAEKPDIQPTPIVIPGTPEPTPKVIHVNASEGSTGRARVVATEQLPLEDTEVAAPITGRIEEDPHMPDYDKVVLALPDEILQQIELISPEGTQVSIGFNIDSQIPIDKIQIPIGDWLGGEFVGIKMSPTKVIELQNAGNTASFIQALIEDKGYEIENPQVLEGLKIEFAQYPDTQTIKFYIPNSWIAMSKPSPPGNTEYGQRHSVAINPLRNFWNNPSFYTDEKASVTGLTGFSIATSDQKFAPLMIPTIDLEK